MLNRNEQQLIDLLNEKNSRLLHELAEQQLEIRRLKKTIREQEKQIAENRRTERGVIDWLEKRL